MCEPPSNVESSMSVATFRTAMVSIVEINNVSASGDVERATVLYRGLLI